MNIKHLVAALTTFIIFSSCFDKSENKNSNKLVSLITKDTIFYPNKNIERIEVHNSGKLLYIDYYDSGKLSKTINYIHVNDKIQPNEFYFYGKNGDTLKSQSLYHVFYYVKDTISDTEKFKFKVVLEGHVFDSAYLALSDVNSNIALDSLPVIKMQNLESPGLSIPGKSKGWNVIRGRIDNYKDSSKNNFKTWAQIYFVDSFYVQ